MEVIRGIMTCNFFFSLLEVNCNQAILFPFDWLKIRNQVLRSHENHA